MKSNKDNSALNKILSAILLLCFLFSTGGYFVIYKIRQSNIRNEIKQEIKQGLKNEDLCLIVLNDQVQKEIRWIKSGQEFKYHDEMFDVVRSEYRHHQEYLYCLQDNKEKSLIDHYQKTHKTGKKNQNIYSQILKVRSFHSEINKLNMTLVSKLSFVFKDSFYRDFQDDVSPPPPKFA